LEHWSASLTVSKTVRARNQTSKIYAALQARSSKGIARITDTVLKAVHTHTLKQLVHRCFLDPRHGDLEFQIDAFLYTNADNPCVCSLSAMTKFEDAQIDIALLLLEDIRTAAPASAHANIWS